MQCCIGGIYHNTRWSYGDWLVRWCSNQCEQCLTVNVYNLALVNQQWFLWLWPLLFMSHRVQHWSIECNRCAYVWVWLEHQMQWLGMRCYTENIHIQRVKTFAEVNVCNQVSETPRSEVPSRTVVTISCPPYVYCVDPWWSCRCMNIGIRDC